MLCALKSTKLLRLATVQKCYFSEGKSAYTPPLYTAEELETVRATLKEEDGAYSIYKIRPGVLRSLKRQRIILFGFNIPTIAALTVLPQLDAFDKWMQTTGMDQYMNVLTSVDLLMCINSYAIYHLINKLMTKIDYIPETNELEITHLGT